MLCNAVTRVRTKGDLAQSGDLRPQSLGTCEVLHVVFGLQIQSVPFPESTLEVLRSAQTAEPSIYHDANARTTGLRFVHGVCGQQHGTPLSRYVMLCYIVLCMECVVSNIARICVGLIALLGLVRLAEAARSNVCVRPWSVW
jgi:hypothetical protein